MSTEFRADYTNVSLQDSFSTLSEAVVRQKCRRFSNNKVFFPGNFSPFSTSWQSIGQQRLTLHMSSFYLPLNIYVFWQNLSLAEASLFLCRTCSAYIQPTLCRDRGVLIVWTAKLTSNCTCGPQVAVFLGVLQPHKVTVESQDYFISWSGVNVTMAEQIMLVSCSFILFPVPHCRSSSNCLWQVWV